jgi:hypothetical protein
MNGSKDQSKRAINSTSVNYLNHKKQKKQIQDYKQIDDDLGVYEDDESDSDTNQ